MRLIAQAIGDAVITFLWSMYIACMKPAIVAIAARYSLESYQFAIFVGLLALNVFVFGWLSALSGGCIWNPAPVLALYSMGAGKDSLISLAVRIPAQAAGAVGGVMAARELVPLSHKHLLGGPGLKVDLYTGAVAELVLTFAITLAVLLVIFKGPKNVFVKNWIITLSTVALIMLGSEYTGPSMNPAAAFAWAYLDQKHNTREHLIVYWAAPLLGSLLAGFIFPLLFSVGKPKEKAA